MPSFCLRREWRNRLTWISRKGCCVVVFPEQNHHCLSSWQFVVTLLEAWNTSSAAKLTFSESDHPQNWRLYPGGEIGFHDSLRASIMSWPQSISELSRCFCFHFLRGNFRGRGVPPPGLSPLNQHWQCDPCQWPIPCPQRLIGREKTRRASSRLSQYFTC